ncbi:MAG: hypothetical protein PSV35_02995 [bacterium]|nr:hypothetical protein [bacterium]
MSARQKKEMKVYLKAVEERNTLINKLEKCDSSRDLDKIKKEYKSDIKKGRFQVRSLTLFHAGTIGNLNKRISNLFTIKTQELISLDEQQIVDIIVPTSPAKLEDNFEQCTMILETDEENEDSDLLFLSQNEKEEPIIHNAVVKTNLNVEDVTPKYPPHVAVEDEVVQTQVAAVYESVNDEIVIEIERSTSFSIENEHTTAITATRLEHEVQDTHYNITCPVVNNTREKELSKVRDQISIIREKALYFDDEGMKYSSDTTNKYYKARDAAISIANNMEGLADLYVQEKLTLKQFKFQAHALFDVKNEDMQVLQTHRGWKQIALNTIAAILGTVVYALIALYQGKTMLFTPATDAGKKVQNLEQAIDAIEITSNEYGY